MKSYNHLFERCICPDNIKRAIERSSLGKRKRYDVHYIYSDKENASKLIFGILCNNRFCPSYHEPHEINDGIKRKKRMIIEPDYAIEQIVHHAIVQTIAPIILKSSYEYSCGSMPGRGAHHGKKYIEKYIKNHANEPIYVLKMDIHHFFESIDHDILMARCRKYFHDVRFTNLLEKIIRLYVVNDETGHGLPIGYYTSQWLANWYLQDLDYYIKQTLHAECMVRYMDDIVILGRSKRVLHKYKRAIERYLWRKLKLRINGKWQVFPLDARSLDFMGLRFYTDKTILRKSIMVRATKKAHKMHHVTWYNASQMLSYLGYFVKCNVYRVYLKYIKPFVNVKKLRRCLSSHSRRLNNEIIMVEKREHCSSRRITSLQRLYSAA